jgi:hypothetical protein
LATAGTAIAKGAAMLSLTAFVVTLFALFGSVVFAIKDEAGS